MPWVPRWSGFLAELRVGKFFQRRNHIIRLGSVPIIHRSVIGHVATAFAVVITGGAKLSEDGLLFRVIAVFIPLIIRQRNLVVRPAFIRGVLGHQLRNLCGVAVVVGGIRVIRG